jgi:hypothetical protein
LLRTAGIGTTYGVYTGCCPFARVQVPEVTVDISLCHWRTESEREDVEEYARMLERQILSPWDQIEEDVRELYLVYWNKEKNKKRVW